MNYYNEFDPKSAEWLRQLISSGEIPDGHVDERSICDVRPEDLKGFTQCHFFAGIGGWSYALKLAGWPTDRPVWTMSCPCQPFSAAGKQLGNSDERHLWPVAFDLIRQCRPDAVFGEQVASAIGHGWLDGISADLEKENTPAGRLYWEHTASAPRISDSGCTGWPTPNSQDAKAWQSNKDGREQVSLPRTAGWASPSSRDWKDSPGMATTGTNPDGTTRSRMDQLPRQAHGVILTPSNVATESKGALNPEHSRWLMGFPAVWGSCGDTAMRSFLKSPRNSSAPILK